MTYELGHADRYVKALQNAWGDCDALAHFRVTAQIEADFKAANIHNARIDYIWSPLVSSDEREHRVKMDDYLNLTVPYAATKGS